MHVAAALNTASNSTPLPSSPLIGTGSSGNGALMTNVDSFGGMLDKLIAVRS
jgi:hypothetical protein